MTKLLENCVAEHAAMAAHLDEALGFFEEQNIDDGALFGDVDETVEFF